MLNFDSGRLSHAYIATGQAVDIIATTAVCSQRLSSGPCYICKHCLKASRKTHPDIIYLNKPADKKDFPIDQIRQLKSDVIITPNEAELKVYIINDAHLMNVPAQNAFLKILEEPPKFVVFILNTDTPVKLLKTTLSRCILIKTDKPAQPEFSEKDNTIGEENLSDDIDISPHQLATEFFIAVEEGNPAIVEFMFKLDKLNKTQFINLVSFMRNEIVILLRPKPVGNVKISDKNLVFIDKLLTKTYEFIDQNVSVGHISGYICANLLDITED